MSADRIGQVLATETSVVLPEHPVTDLVGKEHIELRDVEFTYPGAEHPVLRSISFEARPGQTTAIIGQHRRGKTLVNLLPRLFDATGGSVMLDGVDVKLLDADLLWGRIGLVPQKAYLFSGTRGQQPALRQAGCHRRGTLAGARGRAGGTSSRRCRRGWSRP